MTLGDETCHLLNLPAHLDSVETRCGIVISEDTPGHIVSDPKLATCAACLGAAFRGGSCEADAERADTVLRRFGVDDGVVTMSMLMAHHQTLAIGTALASMFDISGGINYVEIPLASGDGRRFTMTIVIDGGKTPHAMKVEAEAERDRYRAALEHIANGNLAPSIGFAKRVLDGMTAKEAHDVERKHLEGHGW